MEMEEKFEEEEIRVYWSGFRKREIIECYWRCGVEEKVRFSDFETLQHFSIPRFQISSQPNLAWTSTNQAFKKRRASGNEMRY